MTVGSTDEDDDDTRFYFVMVKCGSPRHARGKVANVISYGRLEDEDEWTCSIAQPGLKSWMRKRDRLHRQGVPDEEIDRLVPNRLEPVTPRCNLCHRGLPRGFDHRSGDAEVLNSIAALGLKEVDLEQLHRLASSRHKG